MSYTVNFFVRGHLKETGRRAGLPLSDVREQARKQIEAGFADRVEVRDESDSLVFQWPRTVRNA